MNTLPWAIKILLNIIFYIVYLVLASISYWVISKFLNVGINPGTKLDYIIQIIVGIFVLMFTLLLKKFFYISLNDENK